MLLLQDMQRQGSPLSVNCNTVWQLLHHTLRLIYKRAEAGRTTRFKFIKVRSQVNR